MAKLKPELQTQVSPPVDETDDIIDAELIETSLVPFTPTLPVPSESLAADLSLGAILAKSGFFTDTKGAAQAVVKILAGREMGVGPLAAMTGINIIKGRISLSANLMAALVKRSKRYDYRVKVLTNTQCEIAFYEGEFEIGLSSFTLEDATKAGIVREGPWKAYPRNMLFARALSNGLKWYCPDLLGCPAYTPDEMQEPHETVLEVIPTLQGD